MKRMLDVTKVGFYGNTGDDRSPESFPLPACMASLCEAVTGEKERVVIRASDRALMKRPANSRFLAASGMAFGLLWDKAHCPSALDLTQVNDDVETVRRCFAFAGLACDIVPVADTDRELLKQKIVASVDRGAPVLAFGFFEPPECALVAGYDDGGETLLGYSHFQDVAGLPREENGMFRLENWQDGWYVAIPGEKTAPTLDVKTALENGLAILRATELSGYLAGQAAYDAWIGELEKAGDLPEDEQKALYKYHHDILFSLAELRCWGADFALEAGAARLASCFTEMHDVCWQADAAAGGKGYKALASEEGRAAGARAVCRLKALDKRAEHLLAAFLSGRYASLEQRVTQFYIDMLAPFHPKEGEDEGAQRALYACVRDMLVRAFIAPETLFSPVHEDDAYPNRYNRASYGKPQLLLDMQRAVKKLDGLFTKLFALGQSGEAFAGGVRALAKVNKRDQAAYAVFGLTASGENVLCGAYPGMETALCALCKREGATADDLWQCRFDETYSYLERAYACLLGGEAITALSNTLLSAGYTRVERAGGRCSLDYFKPIDGKEHPLGDPKHGDPWHIGFRFDYRFDVRAPEHGVLRILQYKAILERFGEMPEPVRAFVAAHTKRCDNCRYCVQTDKTGARPLANIKTAVGALCPYFPGYGYTFTRMDAQTAEDIAALLAFDWEIVKK